MGDIKSENSTFIYVEKNENKKNDVNGHSSSDELIPNTNGNDNSKRKRFTNSTDSESDKEKVKKPKKHKRAITSILDSDSDADDVQTNKNISEANTLLSSDSENESRISKIIKRKSVKPISDSESDLDNEIIENTSLQKSPKIASDKDVDSDDEIPKRIPV
mgnify:CR=1 FL=1